MIYITLAVLSNVSTNIHTCVYPDNVLTRAIAPLASLVPQTFAIEFFYLIFNLASVVKTSSGFALGPS